MSTKHTPERWRVDINSALGIRVIMSSSGEAVGKAPIAEIFRNNPYEVPEDVQDANAQRIVDCVNAFEGIEEPASFPILGLVSENAELKMQNKALKDALKRWQDEWVVGPTPKEAANNYSIEIQIQEAISITTK